MRVSVISSADSLTPSGPDSRKHSFQIEENSQNGVQCNYYFDKGKWSSYTVITY